MRPTQSQNIPKLPRKFFCLATDRDTGKHHLVDHDFAIMLTNTQPDYNWQTVADVPEIVVGNGYPKGGQSIIGKEHSSATGISKLKGKPVVFKAAGGSIGPFRWAILYNRTTGALISFMDAGGEDTVAPGSTLTVRGGATGWINGM